jgi:hypothetical protein
MVIDQLHSVLTAVDQDIGADFVDYPGNTGAVFEHFLLLKAWTDRPNLCRK